MTVAERLERAERGVRWVVMLDGGEEREMALRALVEQRDMLRVRVELRRRFRAARPYLMILACLVAGWLGTRL